VDPVDGVYDGLREASDVIRDLPLRDGCSCCARVWVAAERGAWRYSWISDRHLCLILRPMYRVRSRAK